jgi:acetyl-CoA carboxylase beta subunit
MAGTIEQLTFAEYRAGPARGNERNTMTTHKDKTKCQDCGKLLCATAIMRRHIRCSKCAARAVRDCIDRGRHRLIFLPREGQ